MPPQQLFMKEKTMNKAEFIEKLKVAINTDFDLESTTVLADLPEWDSLASVCVITMFEDELHKNLDYATLDKVKTVQDLLDIAGISA